MLIALGGATEHVGRDGEAFADWDQEVGAPRRRSRCPPDER